MVRCQAASARKGEFNLATDGGGEIDLPKVLLLHY
jgi:hypothetical protein